MGTEPRSDHRDYPQWKYEAAVYVLGALTARERYRFERHLRGCPTCRDELVWLAGMPGLLRRLSLADAEASVGRARHVAARAPDNADNHEE
jgi:hypothetical protein